MLSEFSKCFIKKKVQLDDGPTVVSQCFQFFDFAIREGKFSIDHNLPILKFNEQNITRANTWVQGLCLF